MKIIIDDKIPYIHGAFESQAEVEYLSGSKINAESTRDADALIIRTRTYCNKALLSGSNVKLIATATIGHDHIDKDYCKSRNILWTNAPGCNSKSVEQYVLSALLVFANRHHLQLSNLTIGIVGVGNVGSKVARVCSLLGMNMLLNDPPRERNEGSCNFVSLNEIKQQADIITFHTPLITSGQDCTFHLCNDFFFEDLNRKPLIINSARGEVIQTLAVKSALQSGKIRAFVCDCWENEPFVDRELLQMTELATPHIAGYSRDSKANGTQMTVRAVSKFFGLKLDDWHVRNVEEPEKAIIYLDGLGKSHQEIIYEAVCKTYDIRNDDRALKANPDLFENLRDDYPVRREYPAFTIHPSNIDSHTLDILKNLGFETAFD